MKECSKYTYHTYVRKRRPQHMFNIHDQQFYKHFFQLHLTTTIILLCNYFTVLISFSLIIYKVNKRLLNRITVTKLNKNNIYYYCFAITTLIPLYDKNAWLTRRRTTTDNQSVSWCLVCKHHQCSVINLHSSEGERVMREGVDRASSNNGVTTILY